MQIFFPVAEQPFRHFVRVGRSKAVVTWAFLTGLDRTTVKNCGKMGVFDRTTVENCGKMGVFDRTEPDYGGKLW